MITNIKSQCDYCAFKHTEKQSTLDAEHEVEEKYSILRNLIGTPNKNRKISVGGDDDRTETCIINSPNWLMNKTTQTYCDDFIDNSISRSDALKSRDTILLSKVLHDATHVENDKHNSVKNWYEKPIGIIGITLLTAIISALAIYLIRKHIGINL